MYYSFSDLKSACWHYLQELLKFINWMARLVQHIKWVTFLTYCSVLVFFYFLKICRDFQLKYLLQECRYQGSAKAYSLQWGNFGLFFAHYFALSKRGTTNKHIDSSYSLGRYLSLYIYFQLNIIDLSNTF